MYDRTTRSFKSKFGHRREVTKNKKVSLTTLIAEVDMYSHKNESEAARFFVIDLINRNILTKDDERVKSFLEHCKSIKDDRESKSIKYKKNMFKEIAKSLYNTLYNDDK